MNKNLFEEQKQFEAAREKHIARLEAMARAHYHAAQLRGSDLTYEQILEYVQENDSSDYDCLPSPIEWERMGNSK